MSGLIATDSMKMALVRNAPSATDVDLSEGVKVLIYREKPIAERIGSYIIHKKVDKMLTLDTGDRYINASIGKIKRYYPRKPKIETQITKNTKTNSDDKVSQLSDQFMPKNHGAPRDHMLSADECVVKIIKAQDDRSKERNFANAKRIEV